MWQRARENLQHRLVRRLMILSLVGAPLFGVAFALFRHEPFQRSAENGLLAGIIAAAGILFSRNQYWFKKGNRIDWRV